MVAARELLSVAFHSIFINLTRLRFVAPLIMVSMGTFGVFSMRRVESDS